MSKIVENVESVSFFDDILTVVIVYDARITFHKSNYTMCVAHIWAAILFICLFIKVLSVMVG